MSTLTPLHPAYWKRFGFFKVADIIAVSNQEITFNHKPYISDSDWNKQANFVYLVAINNEVVKLGGSGAGLQGRAASFNTGSPKYNEKDNAQTNRKIFAETVEATQRGESVEWWINWVDGPQRTNVSMGGVEFVGMVEYYHLVERFILDHFISEVGHRPKYSQRGPRCDYTITSVSDSVADDIADILPLNQKKVTKAEKSSSMLKLARGIFQQHQNLSRKAIIEMFINVGINPATASSYHWKLSQEQELLSF